MFARIAIPVLISLAALLILLNPFYQGRIQSDTGLDQNQIRVKYSKQKFLFDASRASAYFDDSFVYIVIQAGEPASRSIKIAIPTHEAQVGTVELNDSQKRFACFSDSESVFRTDNYYTGKLEFLESDSIWQTLSFRLDFIASSRDAQEVVQLETGILSISVNGF